MVPRRTPEEQGSLFPSYQPSASPIPMAAPVPPAPHVSTASVTPVASPVEPEPEPVTSPVEPELEPATRSHRKAPKHRKPPKASTAAPLLRPLLKWMGGKHKQASMILDHMAVQPHETYYEPFLGGGAVFCALAYRDMQAGTTRLYRLGDANHRLIEMYRAIQADPDAFQRELATLPAVNTPEDYQRVREEFNAGAGMGVRVAARLLWLNRASFNGLYRENKKGGYNAPIGDEGPLVFPSAERIQLMATALQRSQLWVQDFRITLRCVGPGDVVYLDPPYLVETSMAEGNAGFTTYTQAFGDAVHSELDVLCHEAACRGARIYVSAGAGPRSRATYAHGRVIHQTLVRRSVGATAKRRGLAGEILLQYPCNME